MEKKFSQKNPTAILGSLPNDIYDFKRAPYTIYGATAMAPSVIQILLVLDMYIY